MFSSPPNYWLATVSNKKLLLSNGNYCTWGGLSRRWRKRRIGQGGVKFVNRDDKEVAIAVMATCPKVGERRKLDLLAGELASALDLDREMLSSQLGDDMIRQSWRGSIGNSKVDLLLAVAKKQGCAFDFTLFGPTVLAKDVQEEFTKAVDGFTCEGGGRWKRESY